MSVSIRKFVIADTDAVAGLWRVAFPNDPPRNEPMQMIARKIARDSDLFWVAVDDALDGVIVGAVMAGYDGVRGWIYHLAVTPERRGQGIARDLMSRAIDELRALGCPKVNLQVRGTNSAVIAVYESLGWQEDDNRSYGVLLQ